MIWKEKADVGGSSVEGESCGNDKKTVVYEDPVMGFGEVDFNMRNDKDIKIRTKQNKSFVPLEIEEDKLEVCDEHRFVGDQIRPNLGKIIRIYANNCNGIEINRLIKCNITQNFEKKKDKYLGEVRLQSKLDAIMATMCDWGVNIGCLAGTDTAWEHRAAKKAATKTVCSRLGRCASVTGASSTFKSSSNVKPGGCGIFVDGAWSSRISKRGQDEEGMGRWAYVIIDGRNDAKVMIITAYRVGAQKIEDVGMKTSVAQQYGILCEKESQILTLEDNLQKI